MDGAPWQSWLEPTLATMKLSRRWGTQRMWLMKKKQIPSLRYGMEIQRVQRNGNAIRCGLLFAEDVAHAADLCAYAAEFFLEVFVAAVEVVDAVEDGFAVGYERREYE